MPDFNQVTQLTGVGVAGLSVYLIWKLANNEIHHLTEAINELTLTMRELKEFIQNHIKTK